MELNDMVKDIHANAKEHGWWDDDRSFGEIIALCHSELSEALEEARQGMPMWYFIDYEDGHKTYRTDFDNYDGQKPEGVAFELADCIIRILDYCGRVGIDIEDAVRIKHEFNKSRPYKHGKQF